MMLHPSAFIHASRRMSIGIRTSLPCRSLRGFRCGKYGRSTTALTLPHAGRLAGLESFDIGLRGSVLRTRPLRHIAQHAALRATVAHAPTALHLRPTHELFAKLFECRGIDLLRLLLGELQPFGHTFRPAAGQLFHGRPLHGLRSIRRFFGLRILCKCRYSCQQEKGRKGRHHLFHSLSQFN